MLGSPKLEHISDTIHICSSYISERILSMTFCVDLVLAEWLREGPGPVFNVGDEMLSTEKVDERKLKRGKSMPSTMQTITELVDLTPPLNLCLHLRMSPHSICEELGCFPFFMFSKQSKM